QAWKDAFPDAEDYSDAQTDAAEAATRPTDPNAFSAAFWGAKSTASVMLHSDGRREEQLKQAALLRDIVGNPFRPVALDPAWRTAAVVGLAEAIYAGRAFDRLPILADALEDAGCDNPDVLAHCRGPGPHVRGCWVVDLIL